MKVAMLGPLEVRDGAGSVRAVTGTWLRALLSPDDYGLKARTVTGLAFYW